MSDRACLRALQGALLVASLLVAPMARAGSPNDDDATSQRIAELYKRANALYAQKKLTEAEALYLEAWRLKKTYDVACNFGAVELDLGKPRDAAEYLAFALRELPAGEKPAAREQMKVRLALARAEVGVLHVRVNVPGAQLTVGERIVGKSPLEDEVFVSPGMVTVSASAPGYEQALRTVPITKGSSVDVTLTLTAPRRSVVPGAVLGGVAGAALVTGIGLFAGGRGKGASGAAERDVILNARRSCVMGAANYDARCADVESTATAANTLQKAGVGLMIGAGAATVGAVIYFVLPVSSASAKSGLRVSPALSPNSGGLTLSGAF